MSVRQDAYPCVLNGLSLWVSQCAGRYQKNDRVGVLLNLNDGSILFFRNGTKHGPGYPPGSISAPVVQSVQLLLQGASAALLPDAPWPAAHPQ
jgi:hypothetical protein